LCNTKAFATQYICVTNLITVTDDDIVSVTTAHKLSRLLWAQPDSNTTTTTTSITMILIIQDHRVGG